MTERIVVLEDGPMAGMVIPVPEDASGIEFYLTPYSSAPAACYSAYSSRPHLDDEGREVWRQGPQLYPYPTG